MKGATIGTGEASLPVECMIDAGARHGFPADRSTLPALLTATRVGPLEAGVTAGVK